MNVFDVIRGNGPVVLAQPHGGIFAPVDLHRRLNARGQRLDNTDWHITRLDEFARSGGAHNKGTAHD